jgi:hypothetical protein
LIIIYHHVSGIPLTSNNHPIISHQISSDAAVAWLTERKRRTIATAPYWRWKGAGENEGWSFL